MMHSPSVFVTLLAFIALLGPLVTIHELGHYLVGRWCGVQADAFSVGFGREIWGRTDKHGTRWKLSMLPLGGYVMFAGDATATSMPAVADGSVPPEVAARWLQNKPLWQRSLVVAAGPAANFLLALVIFAAFNMAYGTMGTPPVIAGFGAPWSARAAGLQVGDRIIAVDGASVDTLEEVMAHVAPVPGERLTFVIQRGASHFELPIIVGTRVERDNFGNSERVGRLGIAPGRWQLIHPGPLRATHLALNQCFGMMRMMVTGLRQVATGSRSFSEMAGPVKIAQIAGQQMSLGWQNFVYLVGFVSINLAFINLLPIPALDGGHLLLYAAEAIRRKPLDARKQEWVFKAGMAFVLALMLVKTVNDVAQLHIFGG